MRDGRGFHTEIVTHERARGAVVVNRSFCRRAYVGPMRSALLAAVVGGVVSALVVLALDDDPVPPRPAAAPASPPTASEVFTRARSAIVRVDARPPGTPLPKGRPSREDGVATGTGFLIDRDGTVVTNEHVVAGGSIVSVRFGEDADDVRVRVLGRDRDTDLALLKVPPRALRGANPLALGSSEQVRVGDTAIALGNPLGLERSLTLGVISAVGREIEAPGGEKIRGVVQTDAAIGPGSSGGPLVDEGGRVIGVNSQAEGSGVGYAVPVDTLKRVMRRLRG